MEVMLYFVSTSSIPVQEKNFNFIKKITVEKAEWVESYVSSPDSRITFV